MATAKGKKFTVSEFQTWLDGIMEFQESGWSPSPEQWKSIYQKIQNLKEPSLTSRKVSLDEESKQYIIDNILSAVPDLKGVDFELMNNVLNTILVQLQGGPVTLPSNTQPRKEEWIQNSPQPLQQPRIEGSQLANIPLSELRKREGNVNNNINVQPKPKVLESTDVGEEFV